MTNLDCSVKNCKYNEDNCCCKQNIQVDGSTARNTNETCCGSFVERTDNAMNSNGMAPEKQTNVACTAEYCTYNEDCMCHADNIDIVGNNACSCGETECATFCCKQEDHVEISIRGHGK